MQEATLPVLAGWESFYIITGSAAAALTGLQFVVIVLGADKNRGSTETTRAFGTPTIVHFCAVLLIAGVLSAPWSSLVGITLLLGLCGIVGLVYGAIVIRIARQQNDYKPVLEDWICHFTLPPLAYAALIVAAFTLKANTTLSLFIFGIVVLTLLFVGIHNAWDSVTYIAIDMRKQEGD